MSGDVHDGGLRDWLVCTASAAVYRGCPVLHVLSGSHSRPEAMLVAVLRHACVAVQQGSRAAPVTVEVVS